MGMLNEAEAVNAQRDAHTDDVLERRVDGCPHGRWESAWGMWRCTICGVLRTGAGIPVRSLEEMPREGEMATQMDNILDTSMRLGGGTHAGAVVATAGTGRGDGTSDQERETLGRLVRAVWIVWANEQPSPKPGWLTPWEGMSEPERDVDRRIGAAIRAFDAEHARRLDVEAGASAALAALTEERDAAIQALQLRDDALTLANLRGDAWRDMVQAAETERDAARQVSADFRWLHGHALNRINAPSPWGRILPWLRGKGCRA